MPEFIEDLKCFFNRIIGNPVGAIITYAINEDDNIVMDEYYSPSFYNSGESVVMIDQIELQPKESINFTDFPFAIKDTTFKIRFNTEANKKDEVFISYGKKHTK